MPYAQYLRAVLKSWWILLLSLAISVGIASYVTAHAPRIYETSLTFFVQTPSDQLSVAAQGDTFGQKRVNSYVQLATTDRLISPVLADSKVDLTASQLKEEISASGDLNTVLLTVTVDDTDVNRSLQISRSISTQFVKVVADLETASAGGAPAVRLELVSGPTANPVPISPKPTLNFGLAIFLGLFVGISVAILRQLMDRTFRSAADVEKITDSPVLGVIAFDSTAKLNPLIIDGHAQAVRAEAFRQLRTNLDFIDVDTPVKVIIVTSSIPSEGKSSTATNLAVIFAEAGKTVLLVDADLRRPRVAEYLNIEGAVGLTNVLAGQLDVDEALQAWGKGGLTVLPSGSVPPNPSELLGSNRMTYLMRAMSQRFDIILVDTPPLLPVTDAAVLAAHADGAIVVARSGSTRRQHLAAAVGMLAKVDARLLGCVLNMAPTRGLDAYGYGYGSSYRYYSSSPGDGADAGELYDMSVIENHGDDQSGLLAQRGGKHGDPAMDKAARL